MKCPKCGFESPGGSKFCVQCGNKLEKNPYSNNCPICGEQFDGNVCPKCGSSISNSNNNKKYNYTGTGIHTTQRPNEKWYKKTWFTVVMLILFFPVGLFLMWKYRNNWHIGVKVIITILIFLTILIPNEEKDVDQKPKVETSQESSTEKTKYKDNNGKTSNDIVDKKENTSKDSSSKSDPESKASEIETIPDYSSLSETDYKAQCQELWHDDIFFSDNDLEGQLVKLDLFVEEGRFFESDAMYNVTTSDFIKEYDLQRSFYFCGVQRKDDYSYMGGHISLYFTNKYGFSSSDMKEGDHLIVYGEIVDYSTMSWDGYNSCGIIPRFIENNGQ